jgi:hypothetical protein
VALPPDGSYKLKTIKTIIDKKEICTDKRINGIYLNSGIKRIFREDKV